MPPSLRGLKLRYFRLVLALNDAESLSQAAGRLHVSPAAVSKALVEVESLFGEPLFERGRGWVRPTTLGQAVLATARTVVAETDRLADVVDGLRDGYRGELVIGVRAVSLHPFLADVITEFSDRHPGVTIQLVEGTSARLREMLAEGRIHLLFSRLIDETVTARVGRMPVASDTVAIVASASHPLAARKRIGWPELVDQRWCLPVPGTMMRDHLERLLAGRRLRLPDRFVETSDMTLVALLFGRGHWVTIVPRRVAATYLHGPIGAVLPIDVPSSPDSVGMSWNEALPMRPTAQRFLELARARVGRSRGGVNRT